MSKIRMIQDMWSFLLLRKKWWITPIIAFLLLMSVLMVLTHGSALAPFIYTIF